MAGHRRQLHLREARRGIIHVTRLLRLLVTVAAVGGLAVADVLAAAPAGATGLPGSQSGPRIINVLVAARWPRGRGEDAPGDGATPPLRDLPAGTRHDPPARADLGPPLAAGVHPGAGLLRDHPPQPARARPDACFVVAPATTGTLKGRIASRLGLWSGGLTWELTATVDGDTVAGAADSWPIVANPDQPDVDADGVGDAKGLLRCPSVLGDQSVSSILVLPRVLGLTRSRSRNSAVPSS